MGFSELLFGIIWKLLPVSLRQSLSCKINLAWNRARIGIPLSKVAVYAFSEETKTLFARHLELSFDFTKGETSSIPEYSLLATCRNEADTIAALLDSIARQTRLPAEVVICDGGSNDQTIAAIRTWETQQSASERGLPFAINVLESEPISIAEGRNRAAAAAKCEVLLFTDAGATLDKSWASRMLTPFAYNPATEAVMGWYKPICTGRFQHSISLFLVPPLEAVNPQTFLPSGRSLGVTKPVFESTGGFPVHLTFAGEDSLFDYYLKTTARTLAFVPDAISYWRMPQQISRLAKSIRGYARGDAEGGKLFWNYYVELVPKVLKFYFESFLVLLFLVSACLFWPKAMLILCGIFLGSALIRGTGIVVSYSPFRGQQIALAEKLSRVCAVLLLTSCQTVGFLQGVKSFREVERRRIASARKGHLLLFLPQPHIFYRSTEPTKSILAYLNEGWYVTVVYAPAPAGREDIVVFEHAHIENHRRTEFALEAWWSKHAPFVQQPDRAFAYADLCRDALSRDVTAKLETIGARSLLATISGNNDTSVNEDMSVNKSRL